jgi:hypothetical protein
MFNEMV